MDRERTFRDDRDGIHSHFRFSPDNIVKYISQSLLPIIQEI